MRHYSRRDRAKPSTAVPASNFQLLPKEAESHPPVQPDNSRQVVPSSSDLVSLMEEQKKKSGHDVIFTSATQERPPNVTSIRVSDVVRTFSLDTATLTVFQKSTGSGSTHRTSVASTVLQHRAENASNFPPLSSEPTSQHLEYRSDRPFC